MKLQGYTAFFEMLKSHAYLKKTSTPYNGGADTISRLMEFSEEHPEGWKLKEMQRVDFNGRKIGEPIPMKTFLQNYAISVQSIKTSIVAALGELARIGWIDQIKTRYGALYSAIYLGKFGLEFNGEVYSPIFELPEEGNKSGDSFWLLAAAPGKGNKPTNELEARSVMILNSDLTDNEVTTKVMHAIYQPIYRKWMKEMQELMDKDPDNFFKRKKERPTMSENQFKSAFDLVRETGKKNFYIIFKSGRDEKTLVSSAKRGVRGFGDIEQQKIIRGSEIPKAPMEDKKITQSKFFQLIKGTPFSYFQKGEHKNMEANSYNLLTIVNVKGYNKGVMVLEVRNKSNQVFQLNLKSHDMIKIMKETSKVKKFVEAEVTNVENNKTNTRVQIRYLN